MLEIRACVVAAMALSFGTAARAQQCTWSTVDDFVYPGSATNSPSGIAGRGSRVFVSGTAGFGPDTGRWLTRKGTGQGSAWSTVDDYLPAPSYRAHADAVVIDSQDVIYVAGGTESTAIVPWVVRLSRDDGRTWSVTQSLGTSAQARALATQRNGATFAGGNVAVGGPWHWTVTRTDNHGASWGLSDQQAPTLGAAVVTGLAASDTATYATGYNFVDYQYRWQVRRLSAGAWTLVDDWMPLPGTPSNAFPSGVAALPNGVVLTAGTFYPVNQAPRWTVRRSDNSGATWAVVDDRVDCRATSIRTRRSGREVLLAGRCAMNGIDTWVVYQSSNGGQSWSLSDAWTPSASVGATATAVGFAGGQAYAAGTTFHAGQRHWIVRRRSCGSNGPGGQAQARSAAAAAVANIDEGD